MTDPGLLTLEDKGTSSFKRWKNYTSTCTQTIVFVQHCPSLCFNVQCFTVK